MVSRFSSENIKKAHFVGIGGIGISALARHYLALGYLVTGSDASDSEILAELQDDGVLIYKSHNADNVSKDVEILIYSTAVPSVNPEIVQAKNLGIEIKTYAEAIGELTRKYFTIAVSGSHGKSTTTSLIGLILLKAGYDPTIIVGTKLKELGNRNYRKGESQYLVLEADEWNKSFLNYSPKMIVLTNIDNEHLDTYKNFKGVVTGFKSYLDNMQSHGVLVANFKDKEIRKLAEKIAKKKDRTVIFYNETKFKPHSIGIPGDYNQVNAEGAYQAANFLGIKRPVVESVLREYSGAWRRMEFLGEGTFGNKFSKSVKIFSDYAHHPTEIKATLKAFKEKHKNEKIVCIFEPHQAKRLEALFPDFVSSFTNSDLTIILPAYRVLGRDDKDNLSKIGSLKLSVARHELAEPKDAFALTQELKKRRKKVFYSPDFESVIKTLNNNLEAKSVLVFMGAGAVDGNLRQFISQ